MYVGRAVAFLAQILRDRQEHAQLVAGPDQLRDLYFGIFGNDMSAACHLKGARREDVFRQECGMLMKM